ncbi:SRPBCC domain-containing protein [Agrococcus casei]|uniref:Activator of Hsp90 ATPase homologue 1/2-like C-terminal domain-containing protein n=1 Tax=Agrococcus casei LMG 22410 TaxID=1255656 RepID=A0A1R4FT67_9MICO|nr:SRPBCC domain-containing protein [Agrococcus casei]SJM59017.1 hypothetical protein CZ674_06460 [Agrococcus casei LMG 22410]
MPDDLVLERWFDAGADAVWSHLTDVTRLDEWLGHPLESAPAVGGVMSIDHGGGYICTSVIENCDTEQRSLIVSWSFPDEPQTRVSVQVASMGSCAQSRLTLRHAGLGDLRDEYAHGWATHLAYFEASLGGLPLDLAEFWSVHAALAASVTEVRAGDAG